jgi:hypothetical protein
MESLDQATKDRNLKTKSFLRLLSVTSVTSLGLAFAACSNSISISSPLFSADYVTAAAMTYVTFDQKSLLQVPEEILAISANSRNSLLILRKDGASLEIDPTNPDSKPVKYEAPPEAKADGVTVVPVGQNAFWSVSKEKLLLKFKKDADSDVEASANTNFNEDPIVLSASRTSLLLKVGSMLKLLQFSTKLEMTYNGNLDFGGKAPAINKLLGAGLVGTSGFWVSDGVSTAVIKVTNLAETPKIILQNIKIPSADIDFVTLRINDKGSKPKVVGSIFAYSKAAKMIVKSQNDLIGDDPEDAPPSQSTATVSPTPTPVADQTAAPKVTATPDVPAKPDIKLVEFDTMYRTVIQNSCINNCHTHGFQDGNAPTFARVKNSAVGMKGRLDNRSMPRAPVTITDAQRKMLSDWLATLNP